MKFATQPKKLNVKETRCVIQNGFNIKNGHCMINWSQLGEEILKINK